MNGATDIALTFADYVEAANAQALTVRTTLRADKKHDRRDRSSCKRTRVVDLVQIRAVRRNRPEVVAVNEADLIATYPRLFHMAEDGSWLSIERHGLLSTSVNRPGSVGGSES